MDTAYSYASGVCAMVKSKPRKIRRSISGSSIDVRGKVVMEKVWLFEGKQQSGSTENLSETDTGTDSWCKKHVWTFSTNMSPAQLCAKCNKRILIKRGAYKCTACKQLCHLKCAIKSEETNASSTDQDTDVRTRAPAGAVMDRRGRRCVVRNAESSSRFTKQSLTSRKVAPFTRQPLVQSKTSNQNGEQRVSTNRSRERKTKAEQQEVKASSNIEEDPDFDDAMADGSTQTQNVSLQSQAKLRLTSMKHGLVKRCRSLRDKVKSRKGANSGSDDQTTQGSQETSASSSGDPRAQVNRDKDVAWLTSPVLARLEKRRLELMMSRGSGTSKGSGSGVSGSNPASTASRRGASSASRQRAARRRRFCASDLDTSGIGERLTEVEKKVLDIEGRLAVVVQRVEELDVSSSLDRCHRHKQQYEMTDREDCMVEMAADDHNLQETHPKHLEAEVEITQSASQTSTSDDVYMVPDGYTSSQDNDGHMIHENGHMIHENGHRVHENGHMVHENGHMIHENGHRIHENGHRVHENGHRVHENGHMVGEDEHMMLQREEHTRNTTCLSSREDSFLPSGIPDRLRTNAHSDVSGEYGDLQTSTPVTNREISFRSASRQYERSHNRSHEKSRERSHERSHNRSHEKSCERSHERSQTITHTNITTINVDRWQSDSCKQTNENIVTEHSHLPSKLCGAQTDIHTSNSTRDQRLERNDSKSDMNMLPKSFDARNDDGMCEDVVADEAESKVLSPEQKAVQSFLERRRRSSQRFVSPSASDVCIGRSASDVCIGPRASNVCIGPRASDVCISGRETEIQMEETHQAGLCASPVASSTLQNGNMNLSDMSPINPSPSDHRRYSFQFEKVKEEMAKLGFVKPRDVDYNSSASTFSYTFRNDSEMMVAGADEDFAAYSRNMPRMDGMASNQNANNNANLNQNTNNSNSNYTARNSNPNPNNNSSCFQNATTGFSPNVMECYRLADDADVEMDVGREHVSMTKRSSPALTVTSDATSLTNVTEFTGDYANSFNETGEVQTKSRWVNKDVFLFGREVMESKRLIDKMHEEKDKEPAPVDGKGDCRKPPVPARRRKSGKQFDFLAEAEKRLQNYQKRNWKDVGEGVELQRLPRPSVLQALDSEPDDDDIEAVEDTISKCVAGAQETIPRARSSSDMMVRDSTREFEHLESQILDEAAVRRSGLEGLSSHDPSLNVHNGYDPVIDRASLSRASSQDTVNRAHINETAKYHFLHDKGITKISSPSLKLIHGCHRHGGEHRNQLHNGLGATADDRLEDSFSGVLSGSESECSEVLVDRQFKIPQLKRQASSESRPSRSDTMEVIMDALSKSSKGSGKSMSSLQNDILHESLKIVDDSQETWDNVLKWINKEYAGMEEQELEAELDKMIAEEGGPDHKEAGHEKEKAEPRSASNSPLEESVYYSFQGQSEELQRVLSPKVNSQSNNRYRFLDNDDNLGGVLMYTILNGSAQDVEELLQSERTIPESEIKDALLWALEQQNFQITMLLLDDICKLIWAAEDDSCVDVFPAYHENHPWQPVFVVMSRQHVQGEWDSFMGFAVYRRKYDLVSDEAALVVNSELVQNNPLSLDDFRMVRKAISSSDLHKTHSKITVVNACPCRSSKDGQVIEKQICIVVHCLLKGFIPFGEDPFPREIDGIPVDVREGYFRLGVGHVTRSARYLERSGVRRNRFEDGGSSEETGSERSASDLDVCATGSGSDVDQHTPSGSSADDLENDWHLESQESLSDKDSLKESSASQNDSGDRSESPRCMISKDDAHARFDDRVRSPGCLSQGSGSHRSLGNGDIGTAESESGSHRGLGNGDICTAQSEEMNRKNRLEADVNSRLVPSRNGDLGTENNRMGEPVMNGGLVPGATEALVPGDGVDFDDIDPEWTCVGPGGDNPDTNILDQMNTQTGTCPAGSGDDQARNRCLLMGTGISRSIHPDRRGTLGGFVSLPGDKTGFITCAHVVGKEGDMVCVTGKDGSVCGQVVKVAHLTQSTDITGADNSCQDNASERGVTRADNFNQKRVDAALVLVDEAWTVPGEFIPVSDTQLQMAGYSSDSTPTFRAGRILNQIEITPCKRHNTLIKYGASSGLTIGRLHFLGLSVRDCHFSKSTHQEIFQLDDQIEIVPATSVKFFDLGDSGALIFMPLDDGDLRCVALAVGCTSYGTCVATPIEYVFKCLGIGGEQFIQFPVQTSD